MLRKCQNDACACSLPEGRAHCSEVCSRGQQNRPDASHCLCRHGTCLDDGRTPAEEVLAVFVSSSSAVRAAAPA